jgi:hypothetical protein
MVACDGRELNVVRVLGDAMGSQQGQRRKRRASTSQPSLDRIKMMHRILFHLTSLSSRQQRAKPALPLIRSLQVPDTDNYIF